MVFPGSKTEARLLLTLAVLINIGIIIGFMTRPVVAYRLHTPLGYNETIDFTDTDLTVNLESTNMGRTPARVELTVRLYNLSLVSPQGAEISEQDPYSEFRIELEEPIHPTEAQNKTIKITSTGDENYLVLVFSAKSKPSLNPVTGFSDSFATYNPVRPTALLLKQVGPLQYMRVTQR